MRIPRIQVYIPDAIVKFFSVYPGNNATAEQEAAELTMGHGSWVNGSWVVGQMGQQILIGHVDGTHGQYLRPNDPRPINRWLSQSNFKNNFN